MIAATVTKLLRYEREVKHEVADSLQSLRCTLLEDYWQTIEKTVTFSTSHKGVVEL